MGEVTDPQQGKHIGHRHDHYLYLNFVWDCLNRIIIIVTLQNPNIQLELGEFPT